MIELGVAMAQEIKIILCIVTISCSAVNRRLANSASAIARALSYSSLAYILILMYSTEQVRWHMEY